MNFRYLPDSSTGDFLLVENKEFKVAYHIPFVLIVSMKRISMQNYQLAIIDEKVLLSPQRLLMRRTLRRYRI